MEIAAIIELVTKLGAVGLVIFYIWRDGKREDKLAKALDERAVASDEKNGKLIVLIERGQDAAVKTAEAQIVMAAALKELSGAIHSIPCNRRDGRDER